jgi:hypothetical protein
LARIAGDGPTALKGAIAEPTLEEIPIDSGRCCSIKCGCTVDFIDGDLSWTDALVERGIWVADVVRLIGA